MSFLNNDMIKKALAFLMLCLLPLGVFANQVNASKAFPPSTSVSYFFVQTADSALLQPGHLVLFNVYPKNIWFADAPSSLAGMISTQHYMSEAWGTANSSFSVVHPNASLAGYMTDPKTGKLIRVNMILTLDDAHFDAKTKTLVYSVKKLLFAHSMQAVTAKLVLQQPTLFIDVFGPGGYPV